MANVYTVPPIPGVKDAFSLIEFITNPEKYKERLTQMESVREDINALVEAHGKVTEIETLLIQARGDRSAAGEDLANATREAAHTRANAEQVMVGANEQAKLERQSAQDFRKKAERDSRERSAQLDTRNATLDAREQALVNRELAATALMEKARELEDKYTKAIDKLTAAGVVV